MDPPLNHVPSSRFLCPKERYEKSKDHQITKTSNGILFHPRIIKSSCFSEKSNHLHSILSRNKKHGEELICKACHYMITINTYYFCSYCDDVYHKECVEAPSILHFPGHSRHPLQLIWSVDFPNDTCFSCDGYSWDLLYYCLICGFSLHVACSKNLTSLTIDNPKRHKHTLHCIQRKSNLTCDVCAFVDDSDHLYACLPCDVIVHKRCIDIPNVIKVSRHNHRLAFTPSSPFKEKLGDCGVCYQKIDINYGEYSCVKGCVYAMHSRCALRSDVSDGKELEGEPEEETFEDILMFEDKGDGVILHQSHPCHDLMKLEKQQLHDHENKQCQACMLPFYVDDDDDGNKVYRCIQQHCDFSLHESCANLPRVKQFMLHVHPLILEIGTSTTGSFVCRKCRRYSCGFAYVCPNEWCSDWKLDMLCASICEPFNHYAHSHPLFITSSVYVTMDCSICQSKMEKQPLNCVECGFVVCFRCATRPYKRRYKHDDEHLLVFSYEEGTNDDGNDFYWCEICEEDIFPQKGFYACNECGVTLHVDCLLGSDPYMKPGETFGFGGTKLNYLSNTYPVRPICKACKRRCPYKIKIEDTSCGDLFCSFTCFKKHFLGFG